MVILLDIDGVLVTEPSWKKVEIGADGFMLFNKQSAENLVDILSLTGADVVLSSTHRISFTIERWLEIFKIRGITISKLSKLNDRQSLSDMQDRGSEIQEWIHKNGEANYVIIDDDLSINNLPNAIKQRWVTIKPYLGIDIEAKQKALDILLNNR
ncbi:HAD domain-containing protein [Mucilaginibacter sp. KACC 22773]|uniref:HAD domain-containing protein n=1 Tax=Mucilaginibacter sp. KACC 22773 TaxID=3025671 RepID=UPI002365A07A|nr:HAD domain-containing protein [Mucilaginibacter sp. KACC 22773]WDF79348.1 HAD domain-containing protein [Mucilaginibacter sp. KACC 22773]